jgi:hypothetical protein
MGGDTNDNGDKNGGNSSWALYQRLVLSEIARLDKVLQSALDKIEGGDSQLRKEFTDAIDGLKEKISALDKTLGVIQAKAALLGTLAGIAVTAIIEYILSLVKG